MAAGRALGTGTLSAGTCALLQDNDQHIFSPFIKDRFLGVNNKILFLNY